MFFAMYVAACLRLRRSCAERASIASVGANGRVTSGVGLALVGKAKAETPLLTRRKPVKYAGVSQLMGRFSAAMKAFSHLVIPPPVVQPLEWRGL